MTYRFHSLLLTWFLALGFNQNRFDQMIKSTNQGQINNDAVMFTIKPMHLVSLEAEKQNANSVHLATSKKALHAAMQSDLITTS
jgi:hypothetical protein